MVTGVAVISVSILPSTGAAILSDIMFLAKKEFDGKMRLKGENDPTTDEGFLSAPGDLCSVTAKSGKDLYIAKAKITYFANGPNPVANGNNEVVLKINGVIVETANFSVNVNTAGGGGALSTKPYEFENIGYKVEPGEIIKLEVIGLDTQIDVEGFIECWEEPTTETPVI